MKKKNNTPLPLKFYKKVTQNLKSKELLESIDPGNDPKLFSSMSDLTFELMPKELINAYLTSQEMGNLPPGLHYRIVRYTDQACSIQAIGSWLQAKQIYRFDPDFWALLTEKTAIEIPADILFGLPYKCIFLEPLNSFVYFDRSYQADKYEFRTLQITPQGDVALVGALVITPGKTLSECLEETDLETAKYACVDPKMLKAIRDMGHPQSKLLSDALQGVLYLCSINADIAAKNEAAAKAKMEEAAKAEEATKVEATAKAEIDTNSEPPKEPEQDRPPITKVKVDEIQKWQVGETVIRTLKQNDLIQKESQSRPREKRSYGWTVRPHVRRAHWHHFWKGPKGKQELIIKWIPPVFVGKESKEVGVTVNKVKGE